MSFAKRNKPILIFMLVVIAMGSLAVLNADAQSTRDDCPGDWSNTLFALQIAFVDKFEMLETGMPPQEYTEIMFEGQDLTRQLLDMRIPPCAEYFRQSALRIQIEYHFMMTNGMVYQTVGEERFAERSEMALTRLDIEIRLFRILLQKFTEE